MYPGATFPGRYSLVVEDVPPTTPAGVPNPPRTTKPPSFAVTNPSFGKPPK
jgi:hypothetical protein